jgi:signal transduction histidine kinase
MSNGWGPIFHGPTEMRLAFSCFTSAMLLTTLVLASLVAERRRAEEEAHAARKGAQDSREELRELAAHVESTRERERARISREIHDELGQSLTALKIDALRLERGLRPPGRSRRGAGRAAGMGRAERLANLALSMSTYIDQMLQIVQRIATELRPPMLDELGLIPAMQWLLQKFQERTGIQCRLEIREGRPLGGEHATAVFRIFQEVMTNVARSAGATRVDVRLEADVDCLHLEVRDNGRGIRPEEIDSPHALGILGMRERARTVGGKLAIRGEAGRGTTVELQLPAAASCGGLQSASP